MMINSGLVSQIVSVLRLLDAHTRSRLVYVFAAMVALGVLESLSLGLFLPLFQGIIDPSSLGKYFAMLSLGSTNAMSGREIELPVLIVVIVIIFIAKNIFQLAIIHGMNGFIYRKQSEFLTRLFIAYLNKPYNFHLSRNTAISLRNLSVSAVAVFSNGLMPILNLAMETVVVVGIGIVLILVEPIITILVGSALAICGVLIHRFVAPNAARWGAAVNTVSADMLQWIGESLGSIKIIKVARREMFFTERFSAIARRKSTFESYLATLIHLPRLVIESVVILLLGAFVIVLTANGADLSKSLPVLGIYAIAVLRLMPSVNRILNQASQIRIGAAAIADVYDDLAQVLVSSASHIEKTKPLEFHKTIELKNISFVHDNALKPALYDVSFSIAKGETIALVGPSGAGKSTLADLLIGLIAPTAGEILIDGVRIAQLPVGWSGRVGYVPQHIFLLDGTLRENISFGHPVDSGSGLSVEAALEISNLKTVVDGLDNGVDSLIGENGSRLSGGQRQRIGIARALFIRPDLLVLDEATSALDLETERSVIDAINSLRGRVTTVIVAHHLSTVRNCDRLVLLDQGRIHGIGSYNDLLNENEIFQRLVKLSQLESAETGRPNGLSTGSEPQSPESRQT